MSSLTPARSMVPGSALFAFDEEGVPAQCTPIITNGLFTGYLSSRETAHTIGLNRSGGTLRAECWNRLPIIRMTNISILPGEKSLTREQMISGTDDGIYMETNKSWSIDDKRYNFQFSCEMGWEIKNGKRARMLKNPSYSGDHHGDSGTPWMRFARATSGYSGALRTAAKASRNR